MAFLWLAIRELALIAAAVVMITSGHEVWSIPFFVMMFVHLGNTFKTNATKKEG